MYTDDQGLFCISNTASVLLYTLISFSSICIVIIARQIVNAKRNQSVYMDHKFKPEDSEEEDEDLDVKSAALGENQEILGASESTKVG